MPLVAISLGSNLGDRQGAIAFAVERLSGLLAAVRLSDIVETEPAGEGLQDQPLYLNAVVVGETTLTAGALLEALQGVEREYGRTRPYRNAPRTLDLDLILFGDAIVQQPGLEVPHPRFRERFFVLGPLAEVAPEMRDPVTGLQVWELLRALLQDETR